MKPSPNFTQDEYLIGKIKYPTDGVSENFTKKLGNTMVRLNYALTSAFIDSGNTLANCISPETFQQIGLRESDMDPIARKVKTAKTGAYLEVLGRVKKKIPLRFANSRQVYWIRPLIIKGLSMPFNIALPFLRKYKIDQLHSQDALKLGESEVVPLTSEAQATPEEMTEDNYRIPVYNHRRIHIPANHSMSVIARLQDDNELTNPWIEDNTEIEGLIEPITLTEGLTAVPTLTKLNKAKLLTMVVMNQSNRSIHLENGTKIGEFDPSYNIVTPDNYIPEEERPHFISALNKLEDQNKKTFNNPSKWPLEEQKEWLEKTFKLSTRPGLEGKPENIKQAQELLLKHISIFGLDDEYGVTDLLEHEIKIEGDHQPIRQPYKPCSPWLRKSLKEQLDKWLKYGVIEPSQSPWSFRLVSSPKKNNKIRWCLDSRALNEITKKDAYRIPSIEDLLSRPSQHKIFSTMDMCGAFHCVRIKKEDREKTAFSTPFGSFQFIRMCFGLSNSPATFSRLVQQILQDVPIELVYSYLDDTLVCGKNLEEHLSTMDDVLTRFAKAGLTLQPDKCDLFNDQVEFLGHKLTTDGIAPLARHLDLINKWPEPTTVREVKSFLGKVTYYRKHIKNMADLALPLYKLTAKDQKNFEFNQDARRSFLQLKRALTSAPILAYPIFEEGMPFILDTDFSGKAIGGVLSQEQNGKEVVIQYGARKLTQFEQNYSSNKGELLAVIHFMRKWRYFLQDKKFLLRTDHEALKYFKTMEHPRGMIARYLRTLGEFQFDPIFRRGSQHSNADQLSRLVNAPSPTPKDEELLDEKMFTIATTQGDDTQQDLTTQLDQQSEEGDSPSAQKKIQEQLDMASEQRKDETLRLVRQWIEKQEKPKAKEVITLDKDVKCYRDIYETLYIENDIIWRKAHKGEAFKKNRICLPEALQEEVIKRVHTQDLAHLKINKTQEKVLHSYYFPNGKKKCEVQVKICEVCQRSQRAQRPQRHTYISTAQEGEPWERLSIDLVGPLPRSPEGNTHILTVKCCFTRYLEAFPLADTTAVSIAQILQGEVICRYGCPQRIHSDQGANLTANLMKELYSILGITPSTTPAYNPKSNPVERSHRELGVMLKAMCLENGTANWESQLRACVYALNTSRNRSTGFTPYFLLFGREASTKTDLIFGNTSNYQARGPSEYVNQSRDRLQVAYQYVRHNLGRAIERSRKAYTDKLKFQPKTGNLVWLCTPRITPGIGKKLSQFYSGPYRVTEKISDVLFRITNHGQWNTNNINVVVSIDRISPYLAKEEPEHREITQEELELEDEFLENIGDTTITTNHQDKLSTAVPEEEDITLPNFTEDSTPVRHLHHTPSQHEENYYTEIKKKTENYEDIQGQEDHGAEGRKKTNNYVDQRDQRTTQTSGEKKKTTDVTTTTVPTTRPMRSTRNIPHPKYQDYLISSDTSPTSPTSAPTQPNTPPPLPPRTPMMTREMMRQNFYQLNTPNGPKRPREEDQRGPDNPREGDKWARREAPKRPTNEESPNDQSGYIPPKQSKLPTEDTEDRDLNMERDKKDLTE